MFYEAVYNLNKTLFKNFITVSFSITTASSQPNSTLNEPHEENCNARLVFISEVDLPKCEL